MVQRESSEASSGDREVTLRIDGAVAYVLFDRPWARNAMTLAIYDGLATACAAINENSRVRVAVLRGAGGKAFVATNSVRCGHPVSRKCNANGLVWKTEVRTFTPLQPQN
jgi:enoyl-CoA hydratase/carnithine racemase